MYVLRPSGRSVVVGGGEKHFSAGLDGVRAEAKSSVKRKKNVSKDRSTFEGGKKSAFI